MAFKIATSTGGDYLDLKALTADGKPVLAMFRLVEFLPPSQGDYGTKYDVRADVLICSGPRAGEVCLSEKFMGAVTNTLRGAKRDDPVPTNDLGDEVAVRLDRNVSKTGVVSIYANVPSDADITAIKAVWADGAGWRGKLDEHGSPAMAGAGAPAAQGRPF